MGKDVLKWNVSKQFERRSVGKFSARRPRKKLRRGQENSGARAAAAQSSMDLGAGITVAEAERLMLWPAGVTDGWCTKVEMNHDRALRMKMIGNAISGQHLREILAKWNSTDYQPTMRNATKAPVGPDPGRMEWQQLERELSAMTIDQLDDWIAQRTDGYELPMLDLEVEEGTGPYAKPGVSYSIPAG